MKRYRLVLLAALVSLFAAACSSPTSLPYPQPGDGGSDPKTPPNPGFVSLG